MDMFFSRKGVGKFVVHKIVDEFIILYNGYYSNFKMFFKNKPIRRKKGTNLAWLSFKCFLVEIVSKCRPQKET